MDIFSLLFAIAVTAAMILYLIRLEKIGCKCAMDFKRNYIIYYHIYELISITILILSRGKALEYLLESRHYVAIFSVMGVAEVINILFTLLYIGELKRKDCKCSESFIREFMYYINILYVFISVVVLMQLSLGYGIKTIIEGKKMNLA
jgi:hypothetical protein